MNTIDKNCLIWRVYRLTWNWLLATYMDCSFCLFIRFNLYAPREHLFCLWVNEYETHMLLSWYMISKWLKCSIVCLPFLWNVGVWVCACAKDQVCWKFSSPFERRKKKKRNEHCFSIGCNEVFFVCAFMFSFSISIMWYLVTVGISRNCGSHFKAHKLRVLPEFFSLLSPRPRIAVCQMHKQHTIVRLYHSWSY